MAGNAKEEVTKTSRGKGQEQDQAPLGRAGRPHPVAGSPSEWGVRAPPPVSPVLPPAPCSLLRAAGAPFSLLRSPFSFLRASSASSRLALARPA